MYRTTSGYFRKLPAVDELRHFGQFFGIALGSTRSRPLIENLLFVFGHAAVVGKVAVLGVGHPGRHAAVANDFGNRVSPARNLFVFRHSEGSNLTRTMARDATLVQNPRNLIGEGHLGGRVGGPHPADETADHSGFSLRHRLAGDQLVDRGLKIRLRSRLFDVANSKLVIDATVVTHDAVLIQQEHLGCPGGTELVGNLVVQNP